MNSDVQNTVPQSLVDTLDQNEQIKQRVEECAETLSSVNATLKEEAADHLPPERIKGALNLCREVEEKVEECAADLSSVNLALTQEIAERGALEIELSKSRTEEERARYLAFHDLLTGLPNRALFDDRLNTVMAQALRHQRRFALLFVDLDGFKMINDSHGHAVGDQILRAVAERLGTVTRTEDTVSRHGGDEFLCLLSEIEAENDVIKIVEDIVVKISAHCVIGTLQLQVKASIGIAIFPADGTTASVLINNADAAMYVAKSHNKASTTAKGYWLFNRIESRN